MEMIQNNPELSAYLASDEVIDHEHPLVAETAARLRAGATDAYIYAKAAFEYIRDTIPHCADVGDMRVTWRASDVLAQRTGICSAKAHALAALLRAGSIPAALCYQRLTLGDSPASGFMVHGLVAARLGGAWHRQDPRGNIPGIDAQFSVAGERLAWIPRAECNEMDYPVLYDVPHPAVLEALRAAPDRPYLWRTLPTAL
ncbi:transglutaminase-like domain-containing protein [Streptomyces apocyni]|uniref:transglutaminase-like domain-containing protein n=1 Tax=Streptomyces apocyni TaxID=2654677 RepID=UPI0012EA7FBB|nr:transglutaminase family protein [Streptomyces apocyni]